MSSCLNKNCDLKTTILGSDSWAPDNWARESWAPGLIIRAQLSAPTKWTVGPRGPIVRGPSVRGPTVRGPNGEKLLLIFSYKVALPELPQHPSVIYEASLMFARYIFSLPPPGDFSFQVSSFDTRPPSRRLDKQKWLWCFPSNSISGHFYTQRWVCISIKILLSIFEHFHDSIFLKLNLI